MQQITLAPIPNQAFSVTLNSVRYDIRIYLAANVMCCDLSINGTPIITGIRLVSGALIIPYRYLENGNFLITTLNDELPWYEEFEATQFLIYFTQDELEQARNG